MLLSLNACMVLVDASSPRYMPTKNIMQLGAVHYADTRRQVLISSQTTGYQAELSFCETYSVQHEQRSLEIHFDCQLDPRYIATSKRAFDIYHPRLMDSIASESFYDYLNFDDSQLCIFLVRSNVRYNTEVPIQPCYSLYFSAYPYEPLLVEPEHAKDFDNFTLRSIVYDVYSKFFHEGFHFDTGTNDINAEYSMAKPYAERAISELLASLLERDIWQRLEQIQSSEAELAMTNPVSVELEPSFPLVQQCDHGQHLIDYQESYRLRPDLFYSLLGSDYADVLYEQVNAAGENVSEYLELLFEYLRTNDDFIERAYTFCEDEPTPMQLLRDWKRRRSIETS